MTLPLTQDTLRATYDLVITVPPYSRWNLPDSEDVVFKIVKDPQYFGWYRRIGNKHVIYISATNVVRMDTLVEVMAHEIIHLHERQTGCASRGQHSRAFAVWAAQVCKIFGFDPGRFW